MRRTIGVGGALVIVGLASWVGCEGSGVDVSSGSGGSGGGSGFGTAGVGDACSAETPCRAGLACDKGTNTCVPGHSTKKGGACVISGECKDGLYCASSRCDDAGAGTEGATCRSDGDCVSGLRCALVGLAAACTAEGSKDQGQSCSASTDCFGGLACIGGSCAVPPPGAPFGLPWPGVTCAKESGGVEAYFRVPRGKDDGDFYRLPFPNDIRMKNGKLNLSAHPTPGAALLGYDVVDRYLRQLEADADGWGRYHTTYFRFSGELDLTSLGSGLTIVNLTTGDTNGYYSYEYETARGAYICDNWMAVTRGQGETYDEGATYGVYLTTALKAKGGAPVKRGDDFGPMLGASAPSDATLAAAWNVYAPLRAYLAANSIDPTTLLTAAVFTVGHPTAPIEKLQAATTAAAPPAASGWVKCDTGVVSPCPQSTGDRGCAAADPDFDELHALVTLPIYQQGTEPYLTPTDGGDVQVDGTGTPVIARTEDVCMALTVPKGAAPPGGWPTVVFAHGTGGSFRTHVTEGVAKDFAQGVDDGSGTIVKAAVLGIDQVAHGTRRGTSTAQPQDLFFNFANPKAAKGNVEQAAADQMSLVRFVPSVTFDPVTSPTGTAFTLGPVAFWGHSQGATGGGIAMAFSPAPGAVFSGEGSSLKDALVSKKSPVDIAGVVPFVLSDFASDGSLNGGANNPVLSLLQTYLDAADPVSYAERIARNAPVGVNAHHVFQVYGQKDTFSPPIVEQTFALGAALGLVAKDASVTKADTIGTLTEIPTPATGNLSGGTVTALVREYAPSSGDDGHFVAFDLPSARQDTERFLAGTLEGKVPVVGQ